MNIGQRLMELRTKKGLSQRELGAKCGINASVLNRIENNTRDLRVEELISIMEALDEHVCNFFIKL